VVLVVRALGASTNGFESFTGNGFPSLNDGGYLDPMTQLEGFPSMPDVPSRARNSILVDGEESELSFCVWPLGAKCLPVSASPDDDHL
jgi:hypothetical protein